MNNAEHLRQCWRGLMDRIAKERGRQPRSPDMAFHTNAGQKAFDAAMSAAVKKIAKQGDNKKSRPINMSLMTKKRGDFNWLTASREVEFVENQNGRWVLAQAVGPTWVSAKEQLPPPDKTDATVSEEVLTLSGEWGVRLGWYNHEKEAWRANGVPWMDSDDIDITHWMPIPALPKKHKHQ